MPKSNSLNNNKR